MGAGLDFKPSLYVISAMCGNFWQESTLSPGLWEGRTAGTWTDLLKGYGLGQWTNTGGDTHGRLYQLHEWLFENGYADDDGEGQLLYLIHENTWYRNSDYPEFRSLDDFLRSTSTDIARLTHAYNRCWEGIHDASWDARVDYANECYSYILENASNPDINTWYNGNTYLANSQRLNNAVLVYRFLTDGSTPEPPGKNKKKMPLWMYLKRF